MSNLSIPKILVPLALADAMLINSTVAEPSAGETAWVSAGTFIAGQLVIRTQTHRKYMALLDHTGITIVPELDPVRWKDVGATDKWAMFDGMQSTPTETTGTLTVVIQPGFFNAIAIYGAVGGQLALTVKDAPLGTVIETETWSIDGPYIDEYDWCWGPYRARNKFLLTGILPYPSAEITVTVTASGGAPVGIGMLAIGSLRPLMLGDWGGTEYGADATPVDINYIHTDDFGYTKIVRRGNSLNLDLSIVMPQSDADYALATLQEVSGVPAGVIATEAPGYAGLNVFGLISGPVKYAGPNHATLRANVKGLY